MKILILSLCFLSYGCATVISRQDPYDIETVPAGAIIELSGEEACDSSPCKLWLRCTTRAGKVKSPLVTISAIPSDSMDKTKYHTVTKQIDPCLIDGDVIKLRLDRS